MGRDNQPKHRQRAQLERKRAQRAGYDRILIVSEGSKTEPNYFAEIRKEFRLHSANLVVIPSAIGTQPLQVVEFAQVLFENGDEGKGIQPRAFEYVYAVFDRDDHATYHNALQKAASLNVKLRNDLGKPLVFSAIPSRPSFELWLLLHFYDVQHLMHRDEVLAHLKTFLPTYDKGMDGTFAATREHLDIATQRAQVLAQRNDPHDDDEPYTGIHEVVQQLINLRN